jgi:chaperone modulatory protein CbpM
MKKTYRLKEISELIQMDDEILIEYVRREWISPASPENSEFDDEDLSRAKLIYDLISDFGVNNEAIPLILHLVDQLHWLQQEIKKQKI